ncbi:hypothetical protein Tco_0893080 [Tanacetum coccineum]|uniref:Uncharacterized protein n=1 Tax=Tanacetum coccineum TaxID=301880 RepID=A0ABQ5CAV9_9ASTR
MKVQQYPHICKKPLTLKLILEVVMSYFLSTLITTDLEYLSGGVLSQKYATSMTKTKAVDYRHIKWIEDLFLNRMWSQVPLEIVDWHNYKHLYWITVRRDDDKLCKFKEGDLNRLRIQDIKDMLLLIVQGKLTNLTVEERQFTRNVVIQRRVEDLQLGVKSYQKKLKPPLCRNMELSDVVTPCKDYQRQSNKDKAGAMIQEIDKQLKTRRIMRSLEKFVGGRPYEEHAEFNESNTNVLERFYTSAGNLVKEILLKLNLPDHRLLKDGGKGSSSFIGCSSDKSLLGCDYVGGEGLHGESSCEDDSVDDLRLMQSRRQLIAPEERDCLVMDLETNERYYKPAAGGLGYIRGPLV